MDKVKIPESGTYKCVILTDGENKVFRAAEGGFHKDVARNVKSIENDLNGYYVDGGGRISIGEKEIRVYGYSVDFGEMNKALLTEYATSVGKTLINDSGVGY